MALDDILKVREKLLKTGEIAERAVKGDHSVLAELGKLAHEADPMAPENFYSDKNTFDVTQGASALGRGYENDLSKKVRSNYEEVLNQIEEKKALSLALSIKPSEVGMISHDEIAKKHKTFLEEAEKLKKGDLSGYLGKIEHKGVQEIMAYQMAINPERIARAYEGYVEELQSELISSFIGEDKKLDRESLNTYIIANTTKLEDEEKKGAYVHAALALSKPK